MRILWLFYTLCLLTVLPGCNTITDNQGDTVLKTIELDTFNLLSVEGMYHVELVQDSLDKIEILAGNKIIDHISVAYDTTALIIEDNIPFSGIKNYEKPLIRLHFTYISRIYLQSAARLTTVKPINCPGILVAAVSEFSEINMSFNGGNLLFYNNMQTTGIFTFSGEMERCEIYDYNAAKVDISGLNAPLKKVQHKSIADIYVGNCNKLEVSIQSTGNVIYTGNPEINLLTPEKAEQLIKK